MVLIAFLAGTPLAATTPIGEVGGGVPLPPGPTESADLASEAAEAGSDCPDPAAAQSAETIEPPAVEDEAGEEDAPAPPHESRKYLLDRLAAGASLGYFNAGPSSILSEIHFDFPYLVIRRKSLYVRGSLQTLTVRTGSGLTLDNYDDSFRAQDIDYIVEAGARDYLNNRIAIAAFIGQEGREQLDQPGTLYLRYVGLSFESVGFPRPGGPSRWEWRLAIGPAIGREVIEADAILDGAVIWDVWRGERYSLGVDGSFKSVFDDLHGQTEYRVGPRWTFPMRNGIRAALFAEWIRGRNPLDVTLGAQGWNFGFKYAEGAYSEPHTEALPDVRGVLSLGRGESRGLGRFALDLSSQEMHVGASPAWIFASLDANAVAGTGVDNLFYVAAAGIDAEVHPRAVFGPRLYHRSNHTVGESSSGSRSLNMVQLSLRTPGWEYTDRLPGRLMPGPDERWSDRIEASLAPGLVTDSSFSEGRSWNLQAGARIDLVPRARAVVPFARLYGEWGRGDVDRREVSIGISTRQNLVVELSYRRDDQLFGRDHRDVFLTVSLFF